MKILKAVVILGIIVLAISQGKAQESSNIPSPPCQQVEIATDSIKKKILSDFIEKSVLKGRFINNKGIVHLTIDENSEGQTQWYLSPIIDDRYKDILPKKFADFQGDIILVYEADSTSQASRNPNPAPYIKCLEEVIGDRVYIRPKVKGRWADYVLPWGRKVTTGRQREETGSGGAVIIIFNDDGTYKTIIPG